MEEAPLSYYKSFLEQYPESVYCRKVIYNLASELSNRERTEYFSRLMGVHKNTFLADLIEKEYGPFEDEFSR